ncbi:AAHS family benzoate transporter-like MFS transporter [Bacillus niacini]|uniref:AAHS family benzoate transporter-like MFS transporter n=1 Tax=Neobacillus niacini TaxID=86668 RepID=A0A852TJ59_9BACI|nr:aromatic acid/H+ symport family MFS transporter [Neobacillus niacini]NYE08279.1 AAHS family benzoate transporter-like MFS transporter [Neobacillus niacini]
MSKINITDVVNEGKFNRFHVGLLICCCLIIVFDMFDLVIYGSVIPILMKEWSISPVQAGAIGSYGFFGMMLGAIFFGVLADKFGRKNILILSVVLFSIFTFLCAFAPGPTPFSFFRFIAGVGIGGVLPNVIALLTDYSPKHLHNTMVSIVMCAFSVGGILAGLIGIYFIPLMGWTSVYWVAAIPLLLIPFMVRYFHDSPAMLLVKGRTKELHIVLSKVNDKVSLTTDTEFVTTTGKEDPGSPVLALFRNNHALGTLMIWIAFFMCLLMINGVSTWLPNLMFSAGYPLGSSLSFMIVLNVGAIIGTLVLGGLADKFGVKKVLVPMFIMSAVSLTLLGFKNNMVILYLLVFITGACTMGAQNISYSFVSQYYPSLMRSTAIGFASGIGRIGGIIGPTFGGILVSLNLSAQMNFLSFAIPGIIAALAFSFVPLKYGNNKKIVNDKNIA